MREELIQTARTMAREGLVVGMLGNASARMRASLLVTPTRMPYPRMRGQDLVTVDLASGLSRSARKPSRELPLHLAIYRARPEVGAVIHTHSPYASAWSYLAQALPRTEEAAYYALGTIATAPPAPTGSAALADSAVRCLRDSQAVLLGRHGAVTVGATLEAALEIARVVEHLAQVAWILRGNRP